MEGLQLFFGISAENRGDHAFTFLVGLQKIGLCALQPASDGEKILRPMKLPHHRGTKFIGKTAALNEGGTFPDPVHLQSRKSGHSRIMLRGGFDVHGNIVQKPLTEKEVGDYELRPAPARFTEKEVRDMLKPDIQAGKADIHPAKPDIGLQTEKAGKPEPEKKSILKDLEAKTPKPREPKASRKLKKQKEETR